MLFHIDGFFIVFGLDDLEAGPQKVLICQTCTNSMVSFQILCLQCFVQSIPIRMPFYPILPYQKATLSIIQYHFTIHLASQLLFLPTIYQIISRDQECIDPFGNLIKLISQVKLIRFNYMQWRGSINKSPIILNAMENNFDTGDLFMNGENHRDKTPSSEFNVTAPENSLLSK